MTLTRHAPSIGLLACVALLVSLIVPYVVLPETTHAGLGVYYEQGWFGPLVIGAFAAVAVVAFGAALRERADPATIAGASLVLGAFLLVMSLQWALAVPDGLVRSISTEAWLEYHRWLVVTLAGVVLASAGGYARALGFL